jgi:hypothetical protein
MGTDEEIDSHGCVDCNMATDADGLQAFFGGPVRQGH